VLLKVHDSWQWDGAWCATCHAVFDRRAQVEETATDRWARLYFVILKLLNHPNFEIRIGVHLNVQNSLNFAGT
jgi:hypothetical protein